MSSDDTVARTISPDLQGGQLNRRNILLGGTTLAAASALSAAAPMQMAQAQQQPAAPSGRRPNILVIFGDDIGQTNLSAYSFGLMGYKTPNIDRIAKEGMMFTDYYAEQSCTAGRSSFITGQCTLRTGLSKVGIPGADRRPAAKGRDACSVAQAARLRHRAIWQKSSRRHATNFCRRCMVSTNSTATSITSTPRKIRNPVRIPQIPRFTGARPARCHQVARLPTATTRPISRAGARSASRPSRIPDRSTRSAWRALTMRPAQRRSISSSDKARPTGRSSAGSIPRACILRTHVRFPPRSPGLSRISEYADGMIEHDAVIGTILKAVDDLGIGNDTIVIYTTDNGPHQNSWPDAGTTPFRSEKNTNWEGAFRVPCLIRWPGRIKAGEVSNEMISGLDWLPTLIAAAGDPDITNKLLQGLSGRRANLQGPSRWLQSASVSYGPAGAERPQGVHLLQRRWRHGRPALRKLEDRVRGAARAGHTANLGRAVHQAACPETFRPAVGSL